MHGADLAHEAVVLSQKGVVGEDRLRELALEVLRRPGVRPHRKILEAVAALAHENCTLRARQVDKVQPRQLEGRRLERVDRLRT